MTTEIKLGLRDYAIVVGSTLVAFLALPLVAALGFALQLGFVLVFPAILLGTIGYALFTRAEPVVAVIRGIEVPSDVLFWRGHSWARRVTRTCVVVGVDDFAQRMIGPVESVGTARVGDEVRAGDDLGTLWHGERSIRVPAPVSGVVTQVNPLVLREPGSVNASPYGRGWLVEIRPSITDWKSLAHGAKAMRWMRREVDRLALRLRSADAGELSTLSSRVSDETWQALSAEFFARRPQEN